MTANRNHTIDYVEFIAAELAQTKRFYTEVFGWRFTDYGPDYTSFEDGRISGGFMRGQPSGTNNPLVVIFTEDLVACEEKVRAAGGIITKEAFPFPGGRRFHFRDPGGNELAAWHEE